ncbi:hypothetical protein ACV3ZD_01240 [Clostridium perfringens]|uniref:hypothetical protein n=1 Tax=Clostridium perfringens TaxID=1502 RepID=UPI002247C6F9|nr:hypothetical protein [Clostridium perfringens]MCX0413788.1 hypothetical protein [Clostridium perfringens]MDK0681506.1 hypothetical protein [Clostridium perfringens]MDT7980834.1 hypothetical protein [Clostridium perfringens]
MSIRMTGFDKIHKKLNDLQKEANSINGTQVSFAELFTPDFMNQFTNVDSMEKFIDGFKKDLSTEEIKEALETQEWNEYVIDNSGFNSWDEMKQAAGNLYVKNKLGL